MRINYIITILSCLISLSGAAQQKSKTENVILITLDGFRWQEVFTGADSSFMRQQVALKDPLTKQKY